MSKTVFDDSFLLSHDYFMQLEIIKYAYDQGFYPDKDYDSFILLFCCEDRWNFIHETFERCVSEIIPDTDFGTGGSLLSPPVFPILYLKGNNIKNFYNLVKQVESMDGMKNKDQIENIITGVNDIIAELIGCVMEYNLSINYDENNQFLDIEFCYLGINSYIHLLKYLNLFIKYIIEKLPILEKLMTS
ncbi:MAG: hypothetical protein MJA82_00950 [Clostridia bacterium]|nr:hypothetical protein [Clostridia bacterium]